MPRYRLKEVAGGFLFVSEYPGRKQLRGFRFIPQAVAITDLGVEHLTGRTGLILFDKGEYIKWHLIVASPRNI